jgi:predicted alpha/beta hydrolase
MAGRVSSADEVHFVSTRDGWRLALHRHRAGPHGGGAPIILCGGYACNRYFLDYDETYSLARHLARRGFDAWVVEFRGRGLSHATAACSRPTAWTFDDLARIDVPAAIAYVVRAAGRRVAWVGHSMGGLALYAYLGCHPEGAAMVTSGITVASPVVFPSIGTGLFASIGRLLLHVPFSDTIQQRWVLGAMWHLVGQTNALAVGMNPANIDRQVVGQALRCALSNVSRLKLQQLARWAFKGEFASADGTVDYRAALGQVRTPLLVVAGSADHLAPPATVQHTLVHLPTDVGSYLEFGRMHGHSVDYGHVDLILGRAAPGEVFPALARWLSDHSDAR